MTPILCDKCGKSAVERLVKEPNPPAPPKAQTMTEFIKNDRTGLPTTEYLTMHYTTYILFCRSCEYSVEYTPGTATTSL